MLHAVLLVACLAVAIDEDPVPPSPAPAAAGELSHSRVELEPGRWLVHERVGAGFSDAGLAVMRQHDLCELTIEQGKRYCRWSEPEKLGDDLWAYELRMWDELPEGASVELAITERARDGKLAVLEAPVSYGLITGDREVIEAWSRRYRESLAVRDVTLDEIGLTRARFGPDLEQRPVTGVAVAGPDDRRWPAEIFLASFETVSWLTREGEVVDSFALHERSRSLEPFEPRPGELAFVGGGGWGPVSVFESDGSVRFRWEELPYEGDGHAPNQIAAGDLDGDGEAEYAVGTNGGGGLFLLDAAGRIEHHADGSNLFATAIVDVDGDGTLEVLVTGHDLGGDHVVYDAEANPKDVPRRPEALASSFTIVADRDGSPLLAQARNGMLWLSRPDGSSERRFDLPHMKRTSEAQLAWVPWGPSGELWCAVMYSAASPSVHLAVLDTDWRVVHHEEFRGLAEPATVLTALPADAEHDARLLVGAADGLWVYARE